MEEFGEIEELTEDFDALGGLTFVESRRVKDLGMEWRDVREDEGGKFLMVDYEQEDCSSIVNKTYL